jgi:hypothetical protein
VNNSASRAAVLQGGRTGGPRERLHLAAPGRRAIGNGCWIDNPGFVAAGALRLSQITPKSLICQIIAVQ